MRGEVVLSETIGKSVLVGGLSIYLSVIYINKLYLDVDTSTHIHVKLVFGDVLFNNAAQRKH